MTNIRWQKQDPKKTVASIIAPGVKCSLTFKQVLQKLEETKDRETLTARTHTRYLMKGLITVNKWSDRRIDSITVKDALSMKAPGKISALVAMIRFAMTGEINAPRVRAHGKSNDAVLTIEEADISLLPIFRQPKSNGRFYETRVALKERIENAPPEKFYTLPPTERLRTDKMERFNFTLSIKRMFVDFNLPWMIAWCPARDRFFTSRITDWEKVVKPHLNGSSKKDGK